MANSILLHLLSLSATPAPTQLSRPQVPDAVAEGEEESAAAAGPNAGLTREELLQVIFFFFDRCQNFSFF